MSTSAARELRRPSDREPMWQVTPVIEWLVLEGRSFTRSRDLVRELCRRLVEAGIPLWRANFILPTLHPQVLATEYLWRRDADETVEVDRGHDILATPQHQNSPIKVIFEGAGGIRRRLDVPEPQLDFPILEELRAEGASDYVAMPITFSSGLTNAVTWASDRPGGFRTEELRQLDDLLPVLATILEVQATRRVASTLLDTYLGHDPGARVLDGRIQRGDTETIRAVLWYCDLREFTKMSDRLPCDQVCAILNDYFERTAAPVLGHGGEVLKFIGDGMLAIFRVEQSDANKSMCRALDAAVQAIANIDDLNRIRAAERAPALRFGLALHIGDVMYGNIGAPRRLDFTVIGPAVNLAVRLERVSRKLDRTLIISRDFAQGCTARPLISLGRHRLRDVREPQEVFTLPPEASPQ